MTGAIELKQSDSARRGDQPLAQCRHAGCPPARWRLNSPRRRSRQARTSGAMARPGAPRRNAGQSQPGRRGCRAYLRNGSWPLPPSSMRLGQSCFARDPNLHTSAHYMECLPAMPWSCIYFIRLGGFQPGATGPAPSDQVTPWRGQDIRSQRRWNALVGADGLKSDKLLARDPPTAAVPKTPRGSHRRALLGCTSFASQAAGFGRGQIRKLIEP